MHLAVVIIVVVHQSAPAASLLDVLAQLATIVGFFVIVIAAVLAWLAWRHPVAAQPARGARTAPRRQRPPSKFGAMGKTGTPRSAGRNRSPPSGGGR